MQECKIPQANGYYAQSYEEALEKLQAMPSKYVIKADGLSAGKGVSIHEDKLDGEKQLRAIFHDKIFQESGNRVLIQEFMEGKEASLFAMCNGKEAIYLPAAQDYKPIYENNQGPNTGGMGSYAPCSSITIEQLDFIDKEITQKVISKLQYRGVLYLGLMLHSSREKDLSIVEFNCRFGDPETQAIIPILEEDIFPYLLWTEGQQKNMLVPKYKVGNCYFAPYSNKKCVNVVLSAKGYPYEYPKDLLIGTPSKMPIDYYIFHAGLKKK